MKEVEMTLEGPYVQESRDNQEIFFLKVGNYAIVLVSSTCKQQSEQMVAYFLCRCVFHLILVKYV